MKNLANYSLKDDIYNYLNAQASLTSMLDTNGLSWGQMPDTAVTKTRVDYRMLSDVRIGGSSFRNQRWRFWICVPATKTTPKSKALNISNKMLDLLHEMRGEFGSIYIHFIENDSNEDPFFDTSLNAWVVVQDYKLKMRTLQE